jgi:GTP-binding protein
VIRKELEAYSPTLASKPEVVVATKADVTGSKEGAAALRKKLKGVLEVSAATGEGLKKLAQELFHRLSPGVGVQ